MKPPERTVKTKPATGEIRGWIADAKVFCSFALLGDTELRGRLFKSKKMSNYWNVSKCGNQNCYKITLVLSGFTEVELLHPGESMKAFVQHFWHHSQILFASLVILLACGRIAHAENGSWLITQTSIANGMMPTINNSGEIVYFLNAGGGVYSTTRGQLASSGLFPHLANSGEVVYADWFGGSSWDLVSTTRGRLTYGGIIDVNKTSFDVNSLGEVVYGRGDGAGYQQIYSTVRGQITFDNQYHYNPCINDNGEIVWGQFIPDLGASRTVSTTRGILPEDYGFAPWKLNNLGDICSSGNIDNSFPHVFSSVHGAIIEDGSHFQWGGSVNDSGVYVWQGEYTGSPFTTFQAVWIVPEPSIGSLVALGGFWMLRRRHCVYKSLRDRA